MSDENLGIKFASTLIFLTAAVLGALAYWPAFGGSPLFDDIPLLVNQQCWRGLEQIPAMFSFDQANACTYRPGRYLTFAIDYQIGGFDARLFHLSNYLYHLLAFAAVFLVFRRWSGAIPAAVVAGLWALHPIHTDSVAYISGRRDVVSSLLFLAAFLQIVRPAGRTIGLRHWTAAGLFFALAMFTKEMAVTLPAILLWYAVVDPGERAGAFRGVLKRYWPIVTLLILGAAWFVLYRGVLHAHTQMDGAWWGGSVVSNFATVSALYARYIWLALWPLQLIGDYHPVTISIAEGFGDPRAILGLVIYLGMIAVIILSIRKRWTLTAFGLGWFLITMLPVSHIIPHHELFAEHYLYLPSVGLFLAVLPLAERLCAAGSRPFRAFALAMTVLALAYGARIRDRAYDWRSEMDFYAAAINQAPDNIRVNYYLGVILAEREEWEAAFPYLEMAAFRLDVTTDSGHDALTAYLLATDNTGQRAREDEAIERLLAGHPDDSYGLARLGQRQLAAGEPDLAVESLRAARENTRVRDPDLALHLVIALNAVGQHRSALEVMADYPLERVQACEQEVLALLATQHFERAFERGGACLVRYPNSIRLHDFRAQLLMNLGRHDEADREMETLRELEAPAELLEALMRIQAEVRSTHDEPPP
jgi:Tfp pilus assembly protein PilF